MGYIRGLVHGTVIGTAVGLCIAPQTGDRTRAQARSVANAAQAGYRQAEKAVRTMSARTRHEEPTLTTAGRNGHH